MKRKKKRINRRKTLRVRDALTLEEQQARIEKMFAKRLAEIDEDEKKQREGKK